MAILVPPTELETHIVFRLLPNELWDYSLGDAIRGLVVATSQRRSEAHSEIAIPELGSSLPVRSARAGIVAALKALGLPPGTRIAAPLYCCPVVFKAIRAAGLKVRFIDVDPATYCLSPADLATKSSEVEAVIAVHMFGNMCDMPILRAAAPGKPVIEDCAQALGSRLGGKIAGAFGEIAVFSFRSGKYLSAGEGGAVHCNEARLESRIAEFIRTYPIPSRVAECLHVGNTYLRTILRTQPLWGLAGARLWEAYSATMPYASQSPLGLGRIYETDRATAMRRFKQLWSDIERQRANAEYYSGALALEAGMICSEPPGACFNRFQYPVLLPRPDWSERMATRLRDDGISTARPYKEIAAIAATHYGYSGDCPQAERIAATVLVIPCHHGLRSANTERVAECVNRAWRQLVGRRRVTLSREPQAAAGAAYRTR